MINAARGDNGLGPCAYVLFYVNSNARFPIGDDLFGYDAVFDLSSYVQEIFSVRINEQNRRDLELRVAFDEPLFGFVMNLSNPLVLFRYFIFVSCHSSDHIRADQVAARLGNILSGKYLQVFQFIQENLFSVLDIFKHCYQTDILDCLVIVLNNILINVSLDSFVTFMPLLITFLLTLTSKWKQIPSVARLLFLFVSESSSRRLFAFIQTLYNEHKSSTFLQSIDLTYLFQVRPELANRLNVKQIHPIERFGPLILQSLHHIWVYISLLFTLSDLGTLNLDAFLCNCCIINVSCTI
jgi:hypothetical protein